MTTFTPLVVLHIGAAVAAVLMAAVIFTAPKGTTAHRLIGRVTMIAMLVTAMLTQYKVRLRG